MLTLMPRIAHLPGSSPGRDDMLLTAEQAHPFFTEPVVISEKLDGVSLTIRRGSLGDTSIGLRGGWGGALGGRLKRGAELWVALHENQLDPLLRRGYAVLGEWLWYQFSLSYDRLPSAALLYSLCDRRGRMLPRHESAALLREHDLPTPRTLFEGVIGAQPLASFCRSSQYGRQRAEGIVVERQGRQGAAWAKWVRPGYDKPGLRSLSGKKNRILETPGRQLPTR